MMKGPGNEVGSLCGFRFPLRAWNRLETTRSPLCSWDGCEMRSTMDRDALTIWFMSLSPWPCS